MTAVISAFVIFVFGFAIFVVAHVFYISIGFKGDFWVNPMGDRGNTGFIGTKQKLKYAF